MGLVVTNARSNQDVAYASQKRLGMWWMLGSVEISAEGTTTHGP